jgi:threonine aldolase
MVMKIDLRSEFTARPTAAMVEAMVRAAQLPSGFGLREDPTVARLEALAAEKLGKGDALFVPTCMMANQIAIHIRCRPGDVFLTEAEAHVVTSESGAASALSGAMPRPGARAQGVPVHLDGARIFNAATALGRPASDLAELAETVSFNLNKGLCAPPLRSWAFLCCLLGRTSVL